jgi:hypothetical protein
MDFSMRADDGSIRCDCEQTIIEFSGFPVLFRIRQEQGNVQSGGEPGYVCHPRVRLRHNPRRSDSVSKRIAGDNEFWRNDPFRTESCSGIDRHLDQLPVFGEIARDRRKMEQCDAQCACLHGCELPVSTGHDGSIMHGTTGERMRASRSRLRQLLDKTLRYGKDALGGASCTKARVKLIIRLSAPLAGSLP